MKSVNGKPAYLRRNYTPAWLLPLFILFGLVACSNPANAPTVAHTSAATEAAEAVTATATPTVTASPLPPTFTPVPTITNTPNPLATDTPLPTATKIPTATPLPTATPTSIPQRANSLPTFVPPDPAAFSTAVPTAVPPFEVPSHITNVLLLGSDAPVGNEVSRTDSMIIVSINRQEGTASMVSLPRDLYVYIPGWMMNRLNTALPHGASAGYPTGPEGLLADTILYNFGVPIHYYARVDFGGFKTIVDQLGGVEIGVSCRLEDWRLKSPELDLQDEDSWEWFVLEPGFHEMDGEMALWYARSRITTSDFDRGRRQQQLLRAIFNKGLDLNMVPQAPALYNAFRDTVDTNMDIGRILQLAALAPAVRENGIQHLYIVGDQLQPWVVPENGAQVQLPQWESMQNTFYSLLQPPALNRATRAPILVEIVDGADNPDLARLAAENLAWYGFVPEITSTADEEVEETTIAYYAPNNKGSFDWLLSFVMHQRASDIELITDQPYDYDYRIVIGNDFDPCVNQLFAPRFIP